MNRTRGGDSNPPTCRRTTAPILADTEDERESYTEPPPSEPPSGAFNGEDFLFHLYRGNELLQQNSVAEAKEELERALALQPKDVEGQGLLGVVYFRLGLYPRAIQIYEQLARTCPMEVTPRVNLALAYFKTGQLAEARASLEAALALVPDHPRAWGYLGLVHQRQAEYSKAKEAFEKAGQPQMALRMETLLPQSKRSASDEDRALDSPTRREMRLAMSEAMIQLEHSELGSPEGFSLAEEVGRVTAGVAGELRQFEPGQLLAADVAIPGRSSVRITETSAPLSPPPFPQTSLRPTLRTSNQSSNHRLERMATEQGLFAQPNASEDCEGSLFVAIAPQSVLTVKRQHVLSATGSTFEMVFDGAKFPWALPVDLWSRIQGADQVVLRTTAPRVLYAIGLLAQELVLRAGHLVAFEAELLGPEARFPALTDAPFLHFSGDGTVAVQLGGSLRSLAVLPGRTTTARPADVIGWWGRLSIARAATDRDSLDMVEFRGQGTILLDLVMEARV